VATRYEETACSFMGVLCLAAALDSLKRSQGLGAQQLADAHDRLRCSLPALAKISFGIGSVLGLSFCEIQNKVICSFEL
jgi:hypothetical protein